MQRLLRVTIIVVPLAIGACAIWAWQLSIPIELERGAPATLTLLDCRGRELAVIASVNARVQSPKPVEKFGRWLPRVTVALEDHRFYEHGGVDWYATAAAGAHNLKSARIVSGASTITQQLVKLATHRQGRNPIDKIREAIVACKLERKWSKEKILGEYLNRSSYGNRRLGPEAAARAYFGKSAGDLTLSESIYLAGLPQAPSRFNPWRHLERAARRYQQSLVRLKNLGVITSDQQTLLAQSMPLVRRIDPPHLAPHFVNALLAGHRDLHGTITTTLDLDLQISAERLLRSHLTSLNRHDITQAAVVIVDNATGAVRAMVGASDYATSQINAATRTRSCGSTLKPFVYLMAIERRMLTAASVLPDTPDAIRDAYGDYDPQNFNHRFFGPVRVREALGCSLNVPAVVTLSRLGARPAFYELQKWGFDFPRNLDDYGAGFVLGNAEIRLVDLASAYAGLARGGLAMPPKYLASEHHPVTRVASREACAIITDILCDNQAREKSFGTHSPLAFEQRVAAKTGTSSGFRDAWTAGFDGDHTVAVWAGNFSGAPMEDTLAVKSASPLWASLVHELLRKDRPVDPPPVSEALTRVNICAATGLLPSRFTTTQKSELFLRGTEPREDSVSFFSNDGRFLLPAEYAVWCETGDNITGARVQPEPRITNPPAQAHYQIDSSLPLSQQMVEFTSTLGRNVAWSVNEAPQLAQPDGRYFWRVEPGQWKVRAVSPAGVAEVNITVE